MKRVLLGAAAWCCLLSGAAFAADLPTKAPAYRPAAAMPLSWTGFYVGVEGGYGWGHSHTTVTTPPGNLFATGDQLSGSGDGWLGGFAAGADYQTGGWVVGIKGSYDWADISGDGVHPSTQLANRESHTHGKLNWLAMFTGRVGYTPTPDTLLYINGGWAWGKVDRSGEVVNTVTGTVVSTNSGSETRDGWTIGVGGEYRFTPHASVLLQYNYIDFGTDAIISNILTGASAGSTVGRDQSRTLNVFKAGLNYRF